MATVNQFLAQLCVCGTKLGVWNFPFIFEVSGLTWALRSLLFFCHHLHSEITVTLICIGRHTHILATLVLKNCCQQSYLFCFSWWLILMLKTVPRFFICHGHFFRLCSSLFYCYFSRCVMNMQRARKKNSLNLWFLNDCWNVVVWNCLMYKLLFSYLKALGLVDCWGRVMKRSFWGSLALINPCKFQNEGVTVGSYRLRWHDRESIEKRGRKGPAVACPAMRREWSPHALNHRLDFASSPCLGSSFPLVAVHL